jgi:hypothetical protein
VDLDSPSDLIPPRVGSMSWAPSPTDGCQAVHSEAADAGVAPGDAPAAAHCLASPALCPIGPRGFPACAESGACQVAPR